MANGASDGTRALAVKEILGEKTSPFFFLLPVVYSRFLLFERSMCDFALLITTSEMNHGETLRRRKFLIGFRL